MMHTRMYGIPWSRLAVVIGVVGSTTLRADPAVRADVSAPTVAQTPSATATPDPWDAIAPDSDRVLRRRTAPQAGTSPGAVRAAGPSWLRTLGSLAAVVALILLLAWGYRVATGRSLALGGRGRVAGLIDVVSRTALSPRQTLVLVRVGPRMVLLGISPERIETLDTIADETLVSRLAGLAASERPDSASAEFRQALREQERQFAADSARETPAPGRDELSDRLARTLARVRRSARRLGAA